jgi:hypothetical protein
VVGPGHARLVPVGEHGVADARVVGGHHHTRGAGGAGAIGHAHDHGPSGEVGERLARKPARCVARRDDDGEGRHSCSPGSSLRASSSSMTGMPSRIG